MLMLEVVSGHASSMGPNARRVVGDAGLRIGRDADNDWVFPQGYVSRRQAVVRCVNNTYYLEQHGSCPLSVNDPGRPLERNRIVRLSVGDRIWIDDIEILVSEGDALADREKSSAVPLPGPIIPPSIVPAPSGSPVDVLNLIGGGENANRAGARAPAPPNPDPKSIGEHAFVVPPVPSPKSDLLDLPDNWLQNLSRNGTSVPASSSPGRSDATVSSAPRVPPPLDESRNTGDRSTPAVGASLDTLLRAAGIDTGRQSLPPETAQQFGEILRIVVEGTMQVLKARSEIKREFRLPTTQVVQQGNNPLKFSADATDALHKLLVQRSSAYLDAVSAFQDAFDDIRNHQLAMLGSLRAAFDHMFAQFAPDVLEKRISKSAPGGVLGIGGKGRQWVAYSELYKEMLDDQDFAFRRLFGDEFGKAYEQQLERQRQMARAARNRRRE